MPYTVRAGTADDEEFATGVVCLLKDVIINTIPNETQRPGAKSLVTAALIALAGDLLQGVPLAERGQAVEYFQNKLAQAAMRSEG
jgi:hypothetical protein